jgi:hypothetical protein
MKNTNEIDETMITVQHQKVLLVYFELPDSQLSDQLMKAVLMLSVSSRPRVPNYMIGRDRGEE